MDENQEKSCSVQLCEKIERLEKRWWEIKEIRSSVNTLIFYLFGLAALGTLFIVGGVFSNGLGEMIVFLLIGFFMLLALVVLSILKIPMKLKEDKKELEERKQELGKKWLEISEELESCSEISDVDRETLRRSLDLLEKELLKGR